MKSAALALLIFFPVLLFCQPSEYSWRYYRPGNTGLQGDQATALWIDGNGDPYIAANTGNWGEGGFTKFDHTANKWVNYSNVDYPVLGSFDNGDVQILDIVEDFNKNLWMGNFTGAIKFDPQVGVSSIESYGTSNSVLMGYTTDIDVAPDSTVWFSSGGLVRYKPSSGEWTYWPGANLRIAVQPKPDGSYLVWSADIYYGQVFVYNSTTNQTTDYLPSAIGDVAGLPGKDCVDDVGNFWAVRMRSNGDWETLEYQRPDGVWVYPTPPYENVSFYIDSFKAFGNGKAVLVLTNGESWMFDGTSWENFGTWRQGDFNLSIDADNQGNVWVCGVGGAARRDAETGSWQRYRITNTSQIDYFVEDLSIDNEGNVWFTGNAGTGVGGFQKFDGEKWTGFNDFTYGLGYPFPYQADNTQAIYSRPSNDDVVFNPTFHGIHAWDGNNYIALEDLMTDSKGFVEDSQGRLWSLGEYYNVRYYDESVPEWITVPIIGWGRKIITDPILPGTIWAMTDNEILRTDGITSFTRAIEDFPGSAAWFTGLAIEDNGIVWVGTWSQFTSTGSTLIRLDPNTGVYQTWSYDEGWPFPGEHVRPLTITPDGRLWMLYDSEYPSNESGLLWYDGENVEIFPSSPGGLPQWGGLPNSNIKDLEVKEITGGYELWMSCLGRGIAVLTVKDGTTSIRNEKEIPAGFRLSQNYPNPFKPTTTISFSNSAQAFVSIKVFDIVGNEVASLLEEAKPAGEYQVTFDASGLAGGIYFYTLSVADLQSKTGLSTSFSETRKMILLK
ncbi:MAG: T9SS type A sorting domain-containing protein [Bacteroidales bacterium]|nr:T9SS type A sorting domain-containing protein [Bacteroidales bacterium]